jgi:hypothetical protein
VVHAVAEADPLERPLRAVAPLAPRHRGVDQRQLDVLECRGAVEQVEGLEDEADLAVADRRQGLVVELWTAVPLSR